jgi:hypothetical protein
MLFIVRWDPPDCAKGRHTALPVGRRRPASRCWEDAKPLSFRTTRLCVRKVPFARE